MLPAGIEKMREHGGKTGKGRNRVAPLQHRCQATLAPRCKQQQRLGAADVAGEDHVDPPEPSIWRDFASPANIGRIWRISRASLRRHDPNPCLTPLPTQPRNPCLLYT